MPEESEGRARGFLAALTGVGPDPSAGGTADLAWRRGGLSRLFARPGSVLHRLLRAVFSGIWLVYVAQPLSDLGGHGHSPAYIAGAIALVVVFCLCYLWVMAAWEPGGSGRAAWILAPLFALAATGGVVYGVGWNGLWLYVSVACGLLIADRRQASLGVLAATACYTGFSLAGHDSTTDFLTTLLPVALLGFVMIGARKQAELHRDLGLARETVARMAASEERLRLARDMHDLTGQSLSMITLKSELAARLLDRLPAGPDRDRVAAELEQVAAVSRQTLHDIREAISGYRRPTLAVEAITAREALCAAGVTVHDDPGLTLASGTFDPDAEAALAWCLREAVTNVIRHSGADNCHIRLARHSRTVVLEVRDDGRGLDRDAGGFSLPALSAPGAGEAGAGAGSGAGEGTGLRGMSERLAAVGGTLKLRPGKDGFALTATVPAGDRAGDRAVARAGDRATVAP